MRSRSAGWASGGGGATRGGVVLGAKMLTNAGARSGTGKIKGSFILFERAPGRGDDQSLRGCCRESFEHEALLSICLEAREPAKAVRSIHKAAPKARGCSQRALYSSHRTCALWLCKFEFALLC